MIKQSIKSKSTVAKDEVQVVYNLIFKNAYYSLECYKEGSNKLSDEGYYLAEDITDDEGEAETFFYRMVKGKVFPIHIKDMVEDYFK